MTKPSLFDELIDQYKLEKHLAQNSVTDLYLAYDVDENRQVAVEILLPHFSQSRAYAERFVTKMRTVSQIKHPNIAQVLQVGTTPFNNRPYVAREHVETYPLRKRLKQLSEQSSPVNSVYALKLVRQITEALALAERLEIYHYDLQPDKIRLQSNGSVMLVDLGIPRIKNISANGQNVGQDPQYWSPEQVQGKSLDARSHVYSMGVLLYELLTGELPQGEGSLWSTIKRSSFPVGKSNLEQARPDLSPETYRLVNRALRTPQWARFQRSAALRTAIEEAIKAEEFLIRTGAARAQSGNRRLLMVVVSLLALVVVFGLGLLITQGIQPGDDAAQMTASIPAVAVSSPEVTPTLMTPTTETAVSADASIDLLEPAPRQDFNEDTTITFAWSWSEPLTENQRFQVQASSAQSQTNLGSVSAPAGGTTYQLQVPAAAFPDGAGEYRWQVVLLSGEENEPLAQSEPRSLIVTMPPTATHTATPTGTATPEPSPTVTLTPTPIPQVRVIFASASLREGPGVNYGIVDFLFEGTVVNILAIDEQGGEWYNVELTDGSGVRGWLAVSVTERVDTGTQTIPRAATIPPSPTPTWTPTPTPTFTPTQTPSPQPPSGGGDGGGDDSEPGPPPTLTPPPP